MLLSINKQKYLHKDRQTIPKQTAIPATDTFRELYEV